MIEFKAKLASMFIDTKTIKMRICNIKEIISDYGFIIYVIVGGLFLLCDIAVKLRSFV